MAVEALFRNRLFWVLSFAFAAAASLWSLNRSCDSRDPDPSDASRGPVAGNSNYVLTPANFDIANLDQLLGVVGGRVIDEYDVPVSDAHVVIGLDQLSTRTDQNGEFRFTGISPGRYRIRAFTDRAYSEFAEVRASGVRTTVTIRVRVWDEAELRVVDALSGAPVSGAIICGGEIDVLTNNEGLAKVAVGMSLLISARGFSPLVVKAQSFANGASQKIPLHRGAAVSGRVIGPDGVGLRGSDVIVIGDRVGGEIYASTDEQGRWEIPVLAAGTYTFRPNKVGYRANELTMSIDGHTARTDIDLHVSPGSQLHGVVVDAQGVAVVDATVVLTVSDGPSLYTETDSQGRFAFLGIREGSHLVRALRDVDTSLALAVELHDGDAVDVRLVVESFAVSGNVVTATGEAVPGATVRVEPKKAGISLVGGRSDITGDRGEFNIVGLSRGEYGLSARSPNDELGPRLDGIVPVSAGDNDVRVVVPELATLKGRVLLDGVPVAGFGIIISDREEFCWIPPKPVRGDVFVQRGVAIGKWNVVIVGAGFARKVVFDVDVGTAVTDMGVINVDRGQYIRGRVYDLDGTPVPGAVVTLDQGMKSTPGAGSLGQLACGVLSATTDPTGNYEIAGISPPMFDTTTNRVRAVHPVLGSSVVHAIASDAKVVDLTLLPDNREAGQLGR
ncbi:MAG: carboxypeptidase regulatory-like domain-containing protein [Kofleriaceae bacterium]